MASLSYATHRNETPLQIAWAVYPVRMPTVEGGIGASRSGGPSSSFGDEVLTTADGTSVTNIAPECLLWLSQP